ncbi:hypothetical protein H2201_002766 [Coniosporium apollinis]|uniref:F-box domain-containing protein n=1 Tax=Coniosporium apollinis TaxID=61459 RepID=A0ABQ9NXY7_9PEZI|nr:hypothetical protein H2201_002766 [Coniosporium apollinis]
MLDERNRGLQYIKSLEFYVRKASVKPSPGVHNVGQIWPSDLNFPHGSSIVLWSAQNNLRNVEFYYGSWLHGPNAASNAIKTVEHVNRVRITSNSYEGLKHIYILFKNRRISALHLDFRTLAPEKDPPRNNTLGKGADQTTTLLFAHLMPIKEATLSLTRLTLWNVDLSFCDKSWIPLLDHKALRKLELVRCFGTGRFLRNLINHPTTIYEPAHLESLVLVVDADADEAGDIVPAVDHFLQNTPISLEHLWLQLPRQNELPTLAHIARHGITLKNLHLDFSSNRAGESQHSSAHYDIDDLRKHLPRFANITQLGLSLQPFLHTKFTREDGSYLGPVLSKTNPATLVIPISPSDAHGTSALAEAPTQDMQAPAFRGSQTFARLPSGYHHQWALLRRHLQELPLHTQVNRRELLQFEGEQSLASLEAD